MPQDKNPHVKNPDQYEALKDKGMSKEKAARISNTQDSGKKGGKSSKYEDKTKSELYEQAKKIGIEGRSSMSKKELIGALRDR